MDIKAYTEGKAASIEFKSNPKLCENPYPTNTAEWEDWNYGWNSDMSCIEDSATVALRGIRSLEMPINKDSGTAIQTHQYRSLGNGVFIYEPICRCYVSEPDTAGTIYCPLHGEMYKRNGIVQPIKDIHCTM